MSWHVLHLLTPQVKLSKYRGLLRCEREGEIPQQIPFEDLKAIVIAARGVALSSEVLKACMEHKVIVVHCDDKYSVCGLTVPILDPTNPEVLRLQVTAEGVKQSIWRKILHRKIENQMAVLGIIGGDTKYLQQYLKKKVLNESAAAKQYFSEYFRTLGEPELTRRHDDGHIINIMLNYGYAVLQAMVHRSLVVHGLNPIHGMHHIDRYQAHALVYDMLEPWRPFLDLMLYVYMQKTASAQDRIFQDFKKYIAFSQYSWQSLVFDINGNTVKMINSVDYSCSSLSNALLCQNAAQIWLPAVESSHYTDLLKWDGQL